MKNENIIKRYRVELALLCTSIIFFILRFYLATLSSYPFYHGWNEGHYSLIAKGYFEHSLLIQERGGIINWALPPFYSWIVFASFKIFGISDISARLTSILATTFTIPFVYLLAKELYDRDVGLLASLIFLFIPWVVHLSGRVQTDMVMTALMTASIASFIYAYNHNKSYIPSGIFFGLAVFTKQPSAMVIIIIVAWAVLAVERAEIFGIIKRCILPILIGLLPILAYVMYHMINGNTLEISYLVYGVGTQRLIPFLNLKNTLGGVLVGISPLVLLFAFYEIYKSRDLKNILVIWLCLYGLFVLVGTPPSHEYYILPLTVPSAILASKGIFSFRDAFASEKKSRRRLSVMMSILVILFIIPVSYVFLSYTGDFGYTCTGDISSYILSKTDTLKDVVVLTPNRYDPQLSWYLRSGGPDIEVLSLKKEDYLTNISDLRNLSDSTNEATIFLITDGRDGLEGKLEKEGYSDVYTSYYKTKLPSISSEIYTGEESETEYFEQYLSLYKVL
ncbi:MAG: glycosyltransferase family 39 protein [Halobacteriota archaeon]|nr:glycosyltransferase family 39 protein [Halobacteriota archaeon]